MTMLLVQDQIDAGWYRRTASVVDDQARRCRAEAWQMAMSAIRLSCHAGPAVAAADREEKGHRGEVHLLQARWWAGRADEIVPIAALLREMADELEARPRIG